MTTDEDAADGAANGLAGQTDAGLSPPEDQDLPSPPSSGALRPCGRGLGNVCPAGPLGGSRRLGTRVSSREASPLHTDDDNTTIRTEPGG